MSTERQFRAFILDGTPNPGGEATVRDGEDRLFTVTAGLGTRRPARAWLVDGDGNRSREPTVLAPPDPSMTIQAWHGRRPAQMPRAWLSTGRVVQMSPRALARFQSFPDAYALPERAALACEGIGNAVPPLLMRRVMEHVARLATLKGHARHAA
jgi:site-specific DNA-cytosine methylase